MGLNFRKSITLGKGIKLNLGKKSAGISVGVKGAHYSVNTKGNQRATIGIPGTGLSYTQNLGKLPIPGVGGKDSKSSKKIEKEKAKELEKAQAQVEEYNESMQEVKAIHTEGVEPINWNGNLIPRSVSALKDRVLAGDIDAFYEVINITEPFKAITDFGSKFEIGTDDPSYMMAEFDIRGEEVVPTKVMTMTATGKVSEKELTKTAYYEMYQDYVCSVTLRVARDLFALLPVETVVVHAVDDVINTATGNKETTTFLSVAFDRQTFNNLNLNALDPSDAMTNFTHNMKFAKTTGFKPVDQLTVW